MVGKYINKVNELNEKLCEEEFYFNEFKKDKNEIINYFKKVSKNLVPLKNEEINKIENEIDSYYEKHIYPIKQSLKQAEDELLNYAQDNYKHPDLTHSFWKTVKSNVVRREQVIYGLLVDKSNFYKGL